jgi:pimeloyl-ACP methyl ester carboxylesterase
MPFATNPDDSVRIHFHVEGSGPPLVLYHGFTGSLEDWRIVGLTELMSPSFQLILIDARGHGDSDKPHDPAAYTAPIRARDVVSVLDCLHIERAHFLGYSMGGWVGFCLAKYAPERFTSLAIGGADPYREEEDAEDYRRVATHLERGMEHFVGKWEAAGATFEPDERRIMIACDPLAMRAERLARAESPGLDDALTSTRLPSLIYAGALDEPTHSRAQRAAATMPNVTFMALPELDHYEVYHRADLVVPHAVSFFLSVSDS